MNKLLSLGLIMLSTLMISSCGEDDEMACDKSATLQSEGRGFECVNALAGIGPRGTGEGLSVGFVTTDRSIIAFTDDGPLEERTYEGIEEASFMFNGILNLNSVSVTITKLDRESGMVSGRFEATAQGSAGGFVTTGTFTDVVYREN